MRTYSIVTYEIHRAHWEAEADSKQAALAEVERRKDMEGEEPKFTAYHDEHPTLKPVITEL